MSEITLKVPEALLQLPGAERERLVRAGLYEATRARMRQLEAEIVQTQAEIDRFELHYGMPLARFEVEGLSQHESFEVHEDYTDWCYWQSVLEEKQRLLVDLKQLDLA